MSERLLFAAELARRAADTLCRYYSPDGLPAVRKADHTLVTEADVAADRLIAAALGEAYPQDAILSEELQQSLDAPAPSLWVIDPLDGTTNFSRGLRHWGVSIAYLQDGWPELGAIYFPLLNELYTAQRGAGAFLNGAPLHVDSSPDAFFFCCSRTIQHYRLTLTNKCRVVGSAAYDLCAVGRGVASMSLDMTCKVWDIAAGWVVVTEAGGVVEMFAGPAPFPLSAGQPYDRLSFPTLAAASPQLLQTARQKIVAINL